MARGYFHVPEDMSAALVGIRLKKVAHITDDVTRQLPISLGAHGTRLSFSRPTRGASEARARGYTSACSSVRCWP